MGTTIDANDEWIELYNDGETTVSLEEWHLTAEDGTPDITLSGAILPGAYFLLERTDDGSVPSVAAGLIYTGALGNEGEHLTLVNASGATVDSVQGGKNWALGGDNATKATLQRTSSGSWITAVATPGAVNASSPTAPIVPASSSSNQVASQTSQASSTSSSPVSVSSGRNQKPNIPERQPLIELEAPEDGTTPVGVIKTFSARLFDRNGKETLAGRILWNFGDGTTAEGRTVHHAWRYPGEHRVTLFAEVDLFRTPLRAEASFTENITSARVSVSDATGVYTALTNHEAYDVDVSGWKLSSGGTTFTLPRGTRLASGATIRFPRDATGIATYDKNTLALFYPSGAQVSPDVSLPSPTYNTRATSPLALSVSSAPVSEVLGDTSRVPVSSTKMGEGRHQNTLAFSEVTNTVPETPPSLVASPAFVYGEEDKDSATALALWIFFLLALAGAGATAMILVRRAERPLVAAGYQIIDAEAKTRDN